MALTISRVYHHDSQKSKGHQVFQEQREPWRDSWSKASQGGVGDTVD